MKTTNKKNRVSLFFAILLAIPVGVTAQAQVALTIYNQDLALVNDGRVLEFPKASGAVSFPEVAALIDPTSVQIKIAKSPQTLRILEQNFEYDLVSGQKLFEKYLEKPVTIFTKSSGTIDGTLLSATGESLVLQQADGALRVLMRDEMLSSRFPTLPEGLKSRPTLVWLIENTGEAKRPVTVSYLTRGINWHAEYVGVLDENDAAVQFNGWVSIDNHSGASYRDAVLKLVAGDVNLVRQPQYPQPMETMRVLSKAAAAEDFSEKAFFEYHLYTLQRPATVRDNQQKQITFLPQVNARVEKTYLYEGQRDARQVAVLVKFQNKKEYGLGMALPAGKVRLYKADTDKSLLFLGEDMIDHTPKDEEIRLTIGKAFDVVGERRQLSEKALGQRAREQEFEVVLRNHKKADVVVTVLEKFYGAWQVRASSQPPVKTDAREIEWALKVPADGKATLNFTIFFEW